MVEDGSGLPPNVEASIEKHSLVNATSHKGRAEVGAVMSKVLGEFPEQRGNPSVVAGSVRATVDRVNKMSLAEQTTALLSKYPEANIPRQKEEPHGLPPLPGAQKGRTAFRLPPEPSGFMTIGHAMAFTINRIYADMYEGVLWLRFEDTNPRKVAKRYYESFTRGIKWLGISCDHEKSISEDMDVMYDYGSQMIKEGTAYACSCSPETVKKLRFDGTPCEHRPSSPDRNLRIWGELLAKKHKEGEYVIRFKGDMKNSNYSLRDPNIFRVIERTHPLTKDRYSLWPTYYFANTIEDHICGITHVLRSSEFQTELQQMIRESLKLKSVHVVQFSRFNFKGTPVAKRLLRPLVEEKLVSGWDDPRMPTVDGVRRRGILPEAIRQFTEHVGYTKAEHQYDWSMLFSINRKLLDPITRRMFFVPNPVKLEVQQAPKRTVTIPYHPENDLGNRVLKTGEEFFLTSEDLASTAEGTTFRLMDLFNVELLKSGSSPVARYLGDEVIQDTRKLQWVTPSSTEVTVLSPQALFDDEGKFNKNSMPGVRGLVEESASALSVGDIVQFPRYGFCRLDSPGVFVLAHR